MKLGSWMMMLSGMILILSLIGLNIPGLNPINEQVGLNVTDGYVQSADIENSGLFSVLFGTESEAVNMFGIEITNGLLLLLIGGGLITAGLYVATKDTALLIVPFLVVVAGLYVSTSWAIISYINESWAKAIATSVLGILSIGFAMSIIDYFLGR